MKSTIQKKQSLARTRKQREQQAEDEAFGLLIIIRNHYPIKREKVKEMSGLSETRFKAAMTKLKGKYWLVGKYYEPVTNTAVL